VIVIGLMFLSLSLGLSLIFAVSAVDAAVVVKVDPTSKTVGPGDPFSVNVRVEDVTYMNADGACLNFDSGAMQATEIIEGDFLKSAGATLPFGPLIDNTAGTVTFGYSLKTPGVGVSGSGVLATINFNTNSAVEDVFNLDLTNVELYDGNNNEIPIDEIINGTVTIGNPPPSKPSKPSGQTSGEIGFSYPYSTMSTDPGGDDVYYWFDWGDGTNSGWIAWSTPDIYDVEAKAKNVRGAESNLSDPLSVCINGLWEDDPSNSCKERRWTCYGEYEYKNKPDGTDCGCTANNTMKKCCGGTCSDTGICNSTYCGADSACDGKKPGDTCDANKNCNSACKCQSPEAVFDTGSPENPYPSIWGIHNGTIKPTTTIRVHKLYTYPCSRTGGHSEYVTIWNNSGWNVTAKWKGYGGDWHNIAFEESFTLQAGVEYNYTIETGSYPQIHHTKTLTMPNGEITCTKFIDANGKIYKDGIPALPLLLPLLQQLQ
jgi:hypothetical protein